MDKQTDGTRWAGEAQPLRRLSDGALVDRFDRAEAEGRDADALAVAREIVSRHPGSSAWAFNLGRTLAKGAADDAPRRAEALRELARAAEQGFTGIASFEQHTDLEPLRGTPEFETIVATVRANAAQRLDAFKAEAKEHPLPAYRPSTLAEDALAPIIIALHGTGGTGADLLDRLRRVCDTVGAVGVAPDGLRPAGDGYAWTYRDESEWMVQHAIDRAVRDHGGDRSRVILLGFSQGANIALVMTQTHADRFMAVVPICGHYEPGNTALTGAPAPTYLLAGSRDPWAETFERAEREFTEAGGDAVVRKFSGGHAMPSAAELLRAVRWGLEQPARAAGAEPDLVKRDD